MGLLLAGVSACSRGEDQATPPDAKTAAARARSPSAITVSPEPARPTDALRIMFPTPYAIGDVPRYGDRPAESFDNYHVIFSGPGGRHCRSGGFRFALGYLTEKRPRPSRTVVIKRPGLQSRSRDQQNWCSGRYSGHVEYRQPDQPPFERLGAFSFSVVP